MCNNCGNNNCCCKAAQQIVGPMGPMGYTGPKGATGPQGPQGLPGPQGAPGVLNETITVPFIPSQINVNGIGTHQQANFLVLTAIPGMSLFLTPSRLRAFGYAMGVSVSGGATAQFDLFNLTDGLVVPGTNFLTASAVETIAFAQVLPSAIHQGDQIVMRLAILGGAPGSFVTIHSGGMGEGDTITNNPAINSVLSVSPNSISYVKRASIGILAGLSTTSFSTNVGSSFLNISLFDNYGSLVLNQANANVPPLIATPQIVRSNIAIVSTAQAPVGAATRVLYFISVENGTINI